MEIKISVSTNPPPQETLLDYIGLIDKTEADYIHCDVMDGKFVKNKTFGYNTISLLRQVSSKPMDVHLMMKNPSPKIKKYFNAGANVITIHFESFKYKKDVIKCLKKINKLGCLSGVSICPDTPIDSIFSIIPYCSNVLIMSVVPGRSGQSFIEGTYQKIEILASFLKEKGLQDDVTIEVDGGVNNKNIKKLVACGANIFVVGNYVYSSNNYANAINVLKKCNKN